MANELITEADGSLPVDAYLFIGPLVWNGQSFVGVPTTTAAACAIPLSQESDAAGNPSRFFVGSIPANVPAGRLSIAYRLRAGSTPSWATDSPAASPEGLINWGGTSVTSEDVPSGPIPAGYYADLDDLYAEYGRPQVDEWSNIDNSGGANDGMPVPDYGRIQRALTKADDWVNARLRGCRYALPLTGPLAMSAANVWAARYAGRYLYQARGAGDKKSAASTKYDAMIDEAVAEMAAVKAGNLRLDAPDRFPMPSSPVGAGSVRFA